jgi:hypothetical protein
MPVYPIRTATKTGTRTLDFSAAEVFTIPGSQEYDLYDGGYSGVGGGRYQTSGYAALSNGSNTFGNNYRFFANVNFGNTITDFLIYTGAADLGGRRANVINSNLMVDVSEISPAAILDVYFVPGVDTSGGDHDEGYGLTFSIDTNPTFPGAILLRDNFVRSIGDPGLFTAGILHYEGGVTDEHYFLSFNEDGSDVSVKNAFRIDGLAVEEIMSYYATTVGDTFNHTLTNLPTSNQMVLTDWNPTDYFTGNFEYTNYTVELSDAADQALWIQMIDTYGGVSGYLSNTSQFIASFSSTFPLTSLTAFVFNADMTEYERVDVIGSGLQGSAIFFVDENGDYWLQGYDDINSETMVYFLQGADPVPDTPSSYSMTNVFKLPCFTPCTPFAQRRF